MSNNIFEDIAPQDKLPKEAKTDVLKSIERARLLLSIWDLFGPKRAAINLTILKQNEENKENNKP